ncbi:hypothetical protein [Paenibacillus bovis]|uniref:hypothetical protein n=1 Tax=Paenibacillus bovis TaxID=1616788 RepID=UPI000A74CF89|nr:hypothetical protein [Paenibacillus bovis]
MMHNPVLPTEMTQLEQPSYELQQNSLYSKYERFTHGQLRQRQIILTGPPEIG